MWAQVPMRSISMVPPGRCSLVSHKSAIPKPSRARTTRSTSSYFPSRTTLRTSSVRRVVLDGKYELVDLVVLALDGFGIADLWLTREHLPGGTIEIERIGTCAHILECRPPLTDQHRAERHVGITQAVSYTHLTLPTIYSV